MRYVLLLIGFITAVSASSQPARYRSPNGISNRKNHNRNARYPYFLSLRCGLTQFYGELNSQAMHGLAGIGIGRSINKNWSLQFDYNAGTIGGEKRSFFNSYFVNEYNSAEFLVRWDIPEQFNRQEPGSVHWVVYVGLGQIWFSSHAFDLDDNRLLRFTNSQQSARNPLFLRWGPPKGPRGIRKTREGILPIGTSIEYGLLPRFKITLDYRFYFVRTDKLDATSGRRLINPEESESYSNTPNDTFSFLSLSMRYDIGSPKKEIRGH